jgi:purine-binding chemotaxis protein CheW
MLQVYQFVVFTLADQRYAVFSAVVERIVRIVEITPIPHTPEIVLGVINVQGWIIPVIDIRKRFRLPARELQLSDQMLIARTSNRKVVLVVESVTEVVTLTAQDVLMGETILPQMDYIAGVVKRPDGLVLIHDLDRFLSLAEEQALHGAIDSMTP